MATDDVQHVTPRRVHPPEQKTSVQPPGGRAGLLPGRFRQSTTPFVIGGTVIFTLLLNILLYGFYEIRDYYRVGGGSHVAELKQTIEKQERVLKDMEDTLRQFEAEATSMAPANIGSHNAEHRAYFRFYEDEYTKYEKNIEEYNSCIGKRLSRWYVIPIPVRSR